MSDTDDSAMPTDSTSNESRPGTPTESQVWRDTLLECLDKIKSVGDFAVSKQHTAFPNPGLQIEGSHIISLPLTEPDAEAIKSIAKQATYGTGEQSIVDTSVRKTWELSPSEFQFANPQWESYFNTTILASAADGLGLQNITASLQKLLLYEKGSFFKRHKDSETEDGMLGTLVVCLPSRHHGGAVHLSFKSENRTLATDLTPLWDLTALAWFSDVSHEVAELTDGYRLVLTYKLIQNDGPKHSAQFFQHQLDQLRTILEGWEDAGVSTETPLFYPLDHQYSNQPLSIGRLKGRDRAVCQSLQNAGSDSNVLVFLAPMTHVEYHDDDYGDPGQNTFSQGVYKCNGVKLASKLDVDEEGILRADIFDADPDDETIGGYRVGYDHCQGESTYYHTVCAMIFTGVIAL
jgi:hypothetical protein